MGAAGQALPSPSQPGALNQKSSPSLSPMALKPGSNKGTRAVPNPLTCLLALGPRAVGALALALLSSSEQHWSQELVPHPPPLPHLYGPLG